MLSLLVAWVGSAIQFELLAHCSECNLYPLHSDPNFGGIFAASNSLGDPTQGGTLWGGAMMGKAGFLSELVAMVDPMVPIVLFVFVSCHHNTIVPDYICSMAQVLELMLLSK